MPVKNGTTEPALGRMSKWRGTIARWVRDILQGRLANNENVLAPGPRLALL